MLDLRYCESKASKAFHSSPTQSGQIYSYPMIGGFIKVPNDGAICSDTLSVGTDWHQYTLCKSIHGLALTTIGLNRNKLNTASSTNQVLVTDTQQRSTI